MKYIVNIDAQKFKEIEYTQISYFWLEANRPNLYEYLVVL